jgi:uncharacterized protein with PIN domain
MADEMLGRLARYLRFFGHDVSYARGLEDLEIARRAESEGRILVTRDRDLARRSRDSLLLRSAEIGGQLREVRRAHPEASYVPAFDRCAECNTLLTRWVPPDQSPWPDDVPADRVRAGLEVFECPGCSRRFWEGSHAARIRSQVSGWFSEGDGP